MPRRHFALFVFGLVSALFSQQSSASFSGLAEAANADRDANLNFHLASYPKTLNPAIYSSADEFSIVAEMFDTLVEVDPDTGEIACMLCTEYKYSTDNKAVIFKLRKDAHFHDGKPITAADVEFSFRVYLHPKVDNLNLKSDLLAAIRDVEALDEHMIKISFNDVKYSNIFALVTAAILPKHLFDYFEEVPGEFNKDLKFGRSPTGSGPYKFQKWLAGKYVELTRNDDWWGFRDPRFKNSYNFKRLRFKIITDDTVSLQAFLKGSYDFASLQSFQFEDVLERKAKGENLKVEPLHLQPKVGTSFMFIAWNNRLPIFADKDTRHALSLLTDRFSTLDKFSRGLRPPTNGPWGIDSPYQCPKSECPVLEFNPTKANQLLADAGWKDSDGDGVLDRDVNGKIQRLSFSILSGQSDYSKNVLGVYSTEMKKAGIDAKVKLMDWTAMTRIIDDLKFEAYFSGFRSGYPISPRQLWHSANTEPTGSNNWYFVNREVDTLIDSFEKEFNAEKRIQIGRAIHKTIHNEHPITFHHEGGGCYIGYNKSLKGVAVANFRPDCYYWPRWYKTKP